MTASDDPARRRLCVEPTPEQAAEAALASLGAGASLERLVSRAMSWCRGSCDPGLVRAEIQRRLREAPEHCHTWSRTTPDTLFCWECQRPELWEPEDK